MERETSEFFLGLRVVGQEDIFFAVFNYVINQ
jgi:hypothetical protein